MNWKIIFLLSLFGLFMGIGTVFFISTPFEPVCWLAIFIISAFSIARSAPRLHFVHGLLTGIFNSVWITGSHIFFATHYLAHHAREAAMMRTMPRPDSPRLMMAIVGPLAGIFSGVVIGILAFIAGKLLKSRPQAAA